MSRKSFAGASESGMDKLNNKEQAVESALYSLLAELDARNLDRTSAWVVINHTIPGIPVASL